MIQQESTKSHNLPELNPKQKAFCEQHNITKAQFFGIEPYGGYLDFSSLTSIPKGFNPTVGKFLDLRGLTSIPEGFNPTVGGSLYLRSLTSIPEGFNPTVGGYLDLDSLTSIPEGFNPTVGGSLYLSSLTSIPEGFNPTVGENLYLSSLTSIPEGFNPTVGGYLNLDSLTSIPEGFNPTVGGSLYLSSLTSIPEGFNPTVGENLYLSSLTFIPEGFNPTVGGYLNFRSLTSIPEGFNQSSFENKHLPMLQWQNGKYLLVDGIFSEVVSKKGNVWKTKKINKDELFIITDGQGNYAHGKTISDAKADLMFKINQRNPDEYKSIDIQKPMKFEDAVIMYRAITGACRAGIESFLQSSGVKRKQYSPVEIAKITIGQYGHEKFCRFFDIKN